MPTHNAAYKSIRSDAKKRKRNEAIKAELRTIVKKMESLISQAKKSDAQNYLKSVSAKFMQAASKNVIHKSNASRKISRLAKKINQIK